MIRYTLPALLVLGGVVIGLTVPRVMASSPRIAIIDVVGTEDGWFNPKWGVWRQLGEGDKWQIGDHAYRTRDLIGRNI